MGIRIAAIGSDNCNGKLPCVEEREREWERERTKDQSTQIGLTCPRKQVSSKFITSLLLAILEGGWQRRKVCVDCFSNMNASDLMKRFTTRHTVAALLMLCCNLCVCVCVCGFCHPFFLPGSLLLQGASFGGTPCGWVDGWVGARDKGFCWINVAPLDVVLGRGQRTGLF